MRLWVLLMLLSINVSAQDTLKGIAHGKPMLVYLMPEKQDTCLFINIVIYDTVLRKATIIPNIHEFEFLFPEYTVDSTSTDTLRWGHTKMQELHVMCTDTLCRKHVLAINTSCNNDIEAHTTVLKARDNLVWQQKPLWHLTVYVEELGTGYRTSCLIASNLFARWLEVQFPEVERNKLLKYFK